MGSEFRVQGMEVQGLTRLEFRAQEKGRAREFRNLFINHFRKSTPPQNRQLMVHYY